MMRVVSGAQHSLRSVFITTVATVVKLQMGA